MLRRRGPAGARGSCILIVFLISIGLSTALQHVASSPCEPVCATERVGSLQEDTVCLNGNYKDTEPGRNFQRCVGCLLNSTAVDPRTNETDVQWGLFNLRYALASCMFGIPEERVSISSPCQVTCQPLNSSIGYQLTTNSSSADPGYNFCTAGQFDDTRINNCAFCYSLIPEQLYLANFLQALHIACRQTPVNGQPFYPDSNSIFNETLIAGPGPPSAGNSGGGGLHGSVLAIAIALPIVCGILLIGGGCWCCFLFTRNRRRKMAASGRMSRVHSAYADGATYSPVTPKAAWGENELPTEMEYLPPNVTYAKHPSPGLAGNRLSQTFPVGLRHSVHSEQVTPLRTSFQRDDVGPGADQIQDPNLHEQYFGIADGGPDLATPSSHQAMSHGRGSQRDSWVQ